jgi:hypothetical protein
MKAKTSANCYSRQSGSAPFWVWNLSELLLLEKRGNVGMTSPLRERLFTSYERGGMNTIPKGFSETLSTKEKKGKVTNDVEKTLIQDEIPHLGYFLEDFGCFFMFTQRML